MFDDPVFQTLRVYAISGRRWTLALLVVALNVFPDFFIIVGIQSWI